MDPNQAWISRDPLGEALHLLRMSGTLYCASEFTAPWGLGLPAMDDCLMFHVVTAGECWLEVAGLESLLLRGGDLALVPHGHGHNLLSAPGVGAVQLFDLPRECLSERYEIIRHGGGGAPASLVCGAVRFEHPVARQLVRLLPPLLHVEAASAERGDWLQGTLRFMRDEARAMRPGGETVVTRLADILVIQAIRAWIERDPAAQTGWLGALQDRQIGRAIGLIHRDPARDWSLVSLAEAAAMSRSAFAARFTALVGEPAMQYLTRWRMNLALGWLQEGDVAIAALAERLGYQSEAAFSRAFKRCHGFSPGATRRSGRSAAVSESSR